MNKRFLTIYCLSLPALAAPSYPLAGHRSSKDEPSATRAQYIMGTVCEITAYGAGADSAISAAFREISRQDWIMSLFKDQSELSRLNREAADRSVSCSPDLWAVLKASQQVNRMSSGAFDPTVGRPVFGFDHVDFDDKAHAVRFTKPGLRIDPGGIGKGYALDRAAEVMRRRGIRSGFLNFGGQTLAFGPPPIGEKWEVVIADSGLRLRMRTGSVSTSSQSEQPGHILDPGTNQPVARTGSVTVIAKDATSADAWSTALFVLGPKQIPPEFDDCALISEPGKTMLLAGNCGTYLGTNP